MKSIARSVVGLAAFVMGTASVLGCASDTPPAKSGSDVHADSAKGADAGPQANADAAPTAVAEAVASVSPASPAPAPAPTADAPVVPDENDPWSAFHEIPANDILKTTKAAQGRVEACIHAGHKRDPSQSGEVKIKFVINQKGEVLVWKDDNSSMSDEETTKCVGETIKKLHFPQQKTTGNTLGHYSIHTSG